MDTGRMRYATSRHYDGGGDIREAVAGRELSIDARFTVTMQVRLVDGVFDPQRTDLRDLYAPRGRCVAVIDENVDWQHGAAIRAYFAHHGIELRAMTCPAQEKDKNLDTVALLLDFLGVNQCDVARDEPVLVVGGGVVSDTAGLACALLHRRTPYVMVATSIVTAVDAGPSPRTCVNADQFKNSIGAYHPPVLTLVDCGLFGTLRDRHLRHGVAEIVKMGAVDDLGLFELVERHGVALLDSKFGAADPSLRATAEDVVFRTLRSYLSHEGTNAFEVYQDRPHAYGHTWSPGFERRAGLMHGHAVAVDMVLGAHLAVLAGWLDEDDAERIAALCHRLGLATYDPILEDTALLTVTLRAVQAKRGGHALWAPVPRGGVGSVDYLEDVSERDLVEAVRRQRVAAAALADGGLGIDTHVENHVPSRVATTGPSLEDELADYLFDLIGERPAPEEDLFDLGLTSVAASTLLEHIDSAYGVTVGVRVLFEETTVRHLASHVDAALAAR
jgi:3-dehydroquinate synthase